jgi:hypothetical protein
MVAAATDTAGSSTSMSAPSSAIARRSPRVSMPVTGLSESSNCAGSLAQSSHLERLAFPGQEDAALDAEARRLL